jgi:hypothetical protein
MPFRLKFSLPWDMPKYTGVTKLDDWLADYSITVDRRRQQEACSALRTAHAPGLRNDVAQQPAGS